MLMAETEWARQRTEETLAGERRDRQQAEFEHRRDPDKQRRTLKNQKIDALTKLLEQQGDIDPRLQKMYTALSKVVGT